MVNLVYFYIRLVIDIYVLIAVYYYCIKVYGIKATLIMNACLSSLVLILIITGAYSVADLELTPIFAMRIGETEFLITDIIEEVEGRKRVKEFIMVGVSALIMVIIITTVAVILPSAERSVDPE